MTHYEERLEQDLARLREGVAAVGEKVQKALDNAVRALLERDHELAYSTVLGDMPINRDVRGIDRRCHVFVARHLPSSGHLRFVSSVMRLNVALERIGDYAVAISREAVQLTDAPPSTVARDIDQPNAPAIVVAVCSALFLGERFVKREVGEQDDGDGRK